jgi:hypothetical protein
LLKRRYKSASCWIILRVRVEHADAPRALRLLRAPPRKAIQLPRPIG